MCFIQRRSWSGLFIFIFFLRNNFICEFFFCHFSPLLFLQYDALNWLLIEFLFNFFFLFGYPFVIQVYNEGNDKWLCWDCSSVLMILVLYLKAGYGNPACKFWSQGCFRYFLYLLPYEKCLWEMLFIYVGILFFPLHLFVFQPKLWMEW